MFAAIFAVATLAISASAAASGKLISDVQKDQCGNGSQVACCSPQEGKAENGLASDLLNGLNCILVPVIAVPVVNECGLANNVAACCPTGDDNDVLAGANCFPITV